jgi:hypothetical protein
LRGSIRNQSAAPTQIGALSKGENMERQTIDAGGALRIFARVGPVLIAVLAIVAVIAMAPMG